MIVGVINQLKWLIWLIFVVTLIPRSTNPKFCVCVFPIRRFLALMFYIETNTLLCCHSKSLPNTDVVLPSLRPGTVLTVQALSEDDHKFWMQAMGGKEPVSQLPALSAFTSHILLTWPYFNIIYFNMLMCTLPYHIAYVYLINLKRAIKMFSFIYTFLFLQIGHYLGRTYSKERGSA